MHFLPQSLANIRSVLHLAGTEDQAGEQHLRAGADPCLRRGHPGSQSEPVRPLAGVDHHLGDRSGVRLPVGEGPVLLHHRWRVGIGLEWVNDLYFYVTTGEWR